MKSNWMLFTGISLVMLCNSGFAQQILKLEHGHVLDFLYLNNIIGNEKPKQQYFVDIAPVGRELGYKPLIAFKINKPPSLGNYFPDTLAIAAWEGSVADRKATFDELLNRVPDIHQRRFEVWSSFNMNNYYVEKDMMLSFQHEKRYVLTSFWRENNSIDNAVAEYTKHIDSAGGKVLVSLKDGFSIKGYMYDPEYTLISEWPDMGTFEQFHKKHGTQLLERSGIKHVNELHLELIKRK